MKFDITPTQFAESEYSLAKLVNNPDFYDKSFETLLQADPSNKNSAIALIIRRQSATNALHPKYGNLLSDELLFLQRKVSEQDRFSGEVCLPGGKQEKNQTLLEAVIRQTFQETAIQLKRSELMGCCKNRINYLIPATAVKKSSQSQVRRTKSHSKNAKDDGNQNASTSTPTLSPQPHHNTTIMHVYLFVFVLEETNAYPPIKLNSSQMSTSKWVSINTLINTRNLSYFDYTPKIQNLLKVYSYNKDIRQNLKEIENVDKSLSQGISIGMGKLLYGITLFGMNILFSEVIKHIEGEVIPNLRTGNPIQQSEEKEQKVKQGIKRYSIILDLFDEVQAYCCQQLTFQIGSVPVTPQLKKLEDAFVTDMYKLRPKL